MFSLVLFSLNAELVAAEAGCCIRDRGGCEPVFDESECVEGPGVRFENLACDDEVLDTEQSCKVGCCLIGARRGVKYGVECSAGQGQFLQGTAIPFAIIGEPETQNLCPAEIGGECAQDSDCPEGMTCNEMLGICEAAPVEPVDDCSNGIKDPNETDIDCGGESLCGPCAAGKQCEANRDCSPGYECSQGTCREVIIACNRNGEIDHPVEECDTGPAGIVFRDQTLTVEEGCTQLTLEYLGEEQFYTGGRLGCDAFCKVDKRNCRFIPPDQRRNEPTGVCGDGQVNTPNENYIVEQCEPSMNNEPNLLEEACGVGGSCNADCQCEYACELDRGSLNLLPPTITENRAKLSWTFIDDKPLACGLQGFKIFRCDNTLGSPTQGCQIPEEQLLNHQVGFIGADEVMDRIFSGRMIEYEEIIDENKEYCYKVGAVFQGFDALSAPQAGNGWHCIKTGTAFCNGKEGQTFCSPDNSRSILTCNEGALEPLPPGCGVNQVCSQMTPSRAECINQEPCGVCNGLFRVYGGLLINKLLTEGEIGGICEQVMSCTYDYTASNIDRFFQCDEIRSCYDYKSKYACENDAGNEQGENAHCRVGVGGCQWFGTYEALGIGICAPKERFFTSCELCNLQDTFSDRTNKVFSGCDRATCEKFGGGIGLENRCYFATTGPQIEAGSKGECRAGANLGCQNYGTDRESCIALEGIEQEAVVHAGNNGDDNRIDPRSNDRFHYGTCKFGVVSEGGEERCFKDADGDDKPDCTDADSACVTDNNPPTTSISTEGMLFEEGELLIGKKLSIPISVTEQATTFFCINNPQGGCYPGEEDLAICKIQQLIQEDYNKEPKEIRFFSKDTHRNLEVIRRPENIIPILIDTTAPERADPEQNIVSSENRVVSVRLAFEEEVTCNGGLYYPGGAEVKSDDTEEAELGTNAIVNEKGMVFTRTYYNVGDGLYVFNYECEDRFGNIVKGTEAHSISFDGVKIISPQYQGQDNDSYTLTLQVTGEIEEPGCKYTNLGDQVAFTPVVFEDMEGSFEQGPDNTLEAPVTLQPGLNVFQIVCPLLGETKANAAHRIMVAYDQEAPRLETYSTIDGETFFDDSQQYGGAQAIFAGCHDDFFEKQYNLKNLDLGCQEVGYTLQQSERQGSFSFGTSGQEIAGPIIIRPPLDVGVEAAPEQVTITGSDSVNVQSKEAEVDVAPIPRMTITLTDEFGSVINLEGGTAILGPYKYKVLVKSNGIIKREQGGPAIEGRAIFTFQTDEGQMEIDQAILTNCRGQLNDYECTFDLREIAQFEENEDEPLQVFLDVNFEITATIKQVGAQCFPGEEGFEAHEETISESLILTFFNRPISMLLEPIFGPGASPGVLELLHSDLFGYPIYFENGVYYTNRYSLFVTGQVLAPEMTNRIEFYSGRCQPGDAGAALRKQEDDFILTQAVAPGNLGEEIEVLPTAQGETQVITLENRGDFAGRYISFAGDPLISYGVYHQYYKIIAEETIMEGPQQGRIKLTLDAPLEAPIEPSVEGGFSSIAYVRDPNRGHADTIDNYWFGQNITLHNGCNRFYARAIGNPPDVQGQAAEIVGPPTPTRPAQIIVDTVGPKIVSKTPDVGTTNQNTSEIVVVVEEEISDAQLLKESVAMGLRQVEILPDGTIDLVQEICVPNTDQACPVQIEETFEDGLRTYTITYAGGMDGQGTSFDGHFCVELHGKDKATNPFSPSGEWCFGVNDDAPEPPTWKVLNGNEHEGVFFTRVRPLFEIDYTSTPENVMLENRMYRLRDGSDYEEMDQQAVTCGLKDGLEEEQEALATGTEPRTIFEGKVKNVFICRLTQELREQDFNKGYQFLVVAKKLFDDGGIGKEALHPSGVVVIDNEPPEVMTIEHERVYATNKDLSFEMVIKDSGYDLQADLLYDYQDGTEQARLNLEEHEKGDDRYVFTWHVPDFDITKKNWIEKRNRLELRIQDYAGNQPAVVVSDLILDMTPPDIDNFRFIVDAPYQDDLKREYITNEDLVTINGSFIDEDIYPHGFVYTEPGDHIEGETYDIRKDASIKPDRTFNMQLSIAGEDNKVIRKPYKIYIEDQAGHRRSIEFTIITDLQPPTPGQVTVT